MTNYDIEKTVEEFHRANIIKGLSTATIDYYDTMLKAFVNYLNTDTVKPLTQEVVDDYKLYLLSALPSRSSVNTYLRAVRRLLKFAQVNLAVKLIHTDELPKLTFTDNEITTIIGAADPCKKYSVIAVLLLSTGIRSATLRAIRTCDFNREESSLTLRHTKNKKPYILPLMPKVRELLVKYIAEQNKSSTELLFCCETGKALTHNALWQQMSKFLNKLGIDKTGVHIFRHTFAKCVCNNGLNNAIILMRLLGHSSIQQAQHYVNLYGNELRKAMEKYNPLSQ